MAQIDHLILAVNDLPASIDFYTNTIGFVEDGTEGPFQVLRVSPDFTVLLAEWPTEGNRHFAFAMDEAEFESAFARIRDAGLEYGDAFDSVGSQKGPGIAEGARGLAKAVYVLDPSKNLIEIRCYDESS